MYWIDGDRYRQRKDFQPELTLSFTRENGMTTAADNTAGRAVEKKEEKVEKRRALGRGLESLLPGPRIVMPPVQAGEQGGETKTSHFVPDDNSVGVRDGSGVDAGLRGAKPDEAVTPFEQQHDGTISVQAQSIPRQTVVNLAIELIDKNPYQT